MPRVSHVHYGMRDLAAAVRWFQDVLLATPAVNNERMAWFRFEDFGVILDAATVDSPATLGFDSRDCDADYQAVISRGAESIEAPANRPWGSRAAYVRGPGSLIVEIEQRLM